MGYTTNFQGALKFKKELTVPELAYMQKFLGEDLRDSPELMKLTPQKDGEITNCQYCIDLEVTKNYDGLQWDGAEKSYNMETQVNFLIALMKKKYPGFGLTGYMNAQGEDIEDRWRLEMQDGKAVKVETPPKGRKVECPHCGGYFYIDDKC
jgi:hypothetical protein